MLNECQRYPIFIEILALAFLNLFYQLTNILEIRNKEQISDKSII